MEITNQTACYMEQSIFSLMKLPRMCPRKCDLDMNMHIYVYIYNNAHIYRSLVIYPVHVMKITLLLG